MSREEDIEPIENSHKGANNYAKPRDVWLKARFKREAIDNTAILARGSKAQEGEVDDDPGDET
jgi:hypothetical protein